VAECKVSKCKHHQGRAIAALSFSVDDPVVSNPVGVEQAVLHDGMDAQVTETSPGARFLLLCEASPIGQ